MRTRSLQFLFYACAVLLLNRLSSHENMTSIIEALDSSHFEDIKVAITTLKNTLCGKSAVEKLERFEENRKKTPLFSF